MILGVRHTATMVKDMEEALKFYRDLLGLNVVRDAVEEGDNIDGIFNLPGVRFREAKLSVTDSLEDGAIVELEQALTYEGIDFCHTCLRVDDVDKEYRRLLKAGVKFLCLPFTSEDGYGRLTACYDPDGYIVELVEIL